MLAKSPSLTMSTIPAVSSITIITAIIHQYHALLLMINSSITGIKFLYNPGLRKKCGQNNYFKSYILLHHMDPPDPPGHGNIGD